MFLVLFFVLGMRSPVSSTLSPSTPFSDFKEGGEGGGGGGEGRGAGINKKPMLGEVIPAPLPLPKSKAKNSGTQTKDAFMPDRKSVV